MDKYFFKDHTIKITSEERKKYFKNGKCFHISQILSPSSTDEFRPMNRKTNTIFPCQDEISKVEYRCSLNSFLANERKFGRKLR